MQHHYGNERLTQCVRMSLEVCSSQKAQPHQRETITPVRAGIRVFPQARNNQCENEGADRDVRGLNRSHDEDDDDARGASSAERRRRVRTAASGRG